MSLDPIVWILPKSLSVGEKQQVLGKETCVTEIGLLIGISCDRRRYMYWTVQGL